MNKKIIKRNTEADIDVENPIKGPGGKRTTGFQKMWHEEVDVVIVGSGYAGLAAAIEAKKAGASVTILEKMRGRGGNSIISDGMVAAAGSPFQEREGVKDSADLMYNDMLKAGLGLNHPDLARIVAEKSSQVLQWTIEFLGVTYVDRVDQLGGHSMPRTHSIYSQAKFHTGSVLARRMLARVKCLDMEVRTQMCLRRLIKDADGSVKGVEISEGYLFPKPESGTIKHIRARKAVILATGGFANDITFRAIQDPRLTAGVKTTNRRGATAEALTEAMRIGATPVQLSWIQLGPWASPDEKGANVGSNFASYSIFPHGIVIDPGTGKRFVNELGDRKVRADAILKIGRPCIGITDAEGAKYGDHVLPKCLKNSVVKEFDTLEELASVYNIPVKDLKETIERYNSYVKDQKDKEFGKPIIKGTATLNHPSYYAIRLWPKVHHTMGGIQINTKAQVIDLNQQPIKGLYAAGEVTGGIHGACRLGSCAIPDCLVFGRIAGENAASIE